MNGETTGDPNEAIEDLIVACLEQSQRPALEELERLCESHPEHADELRTRFALIDGLGFLDAATDDPPRRIGDFTLLRKLGEGGYGVVHLARQESLGRRVALKLLRPGVARIDEARARFQREVQATARLEHAGICPLLDAGEVEGIPYLALRYVPGETLDKKVARAQGRGEALSIEQVLRWGEQVARALQAAHEVGLVHRDVKPGNVLIDREGTAFLLDFGLARLLDDDLGVTRSGQAVGTPAYLAPEQIEAGVPVSGRTDVYALGVVLYELLTLHCPFEAKTREGLYREILAGRLPDPRRFNRRVPADLRNVVTRSMERNPDRRYATAADFADDLGRARRGETVVARPLSVALRLGRWCRRNPTATVGLAALLVGLLVALLALRESRQSLARESESLARERGGMLAVKSDEALAQNEITLAALLALQSVRLRPEEPTVGGARLGRLLPMLRERGSFKHPGKLGWVRASPDGRYLLSACVDRRVRLLDAGDGRELWTSEELPWVPWAIRFRADGKRFLAGRAWETQAAGSLRVWEHSDGTARKIGPPLHVPAPSGEVWPGCWAADFRPDGSIVAALIEPGRPARTLVYLFPAEGNGYGSPRAMPEAIVGVVWELDVSRDGRVLVACGRGMVYAWTPETDAVEVFDELPKSTFFARWIGRDRFVSATGRRGPYGQNARGGEDSCIRLFRLGQSKPIAQSKPHGNIIQWLDVHGTRVVTASEDNFIRLWSIPESPTDDWGPEWKKNLGSRLRIARFSPDGDLVLSGTENGNLYVHDLHRTERMRVEAHLRDVRDVVGIPGSQSFASSSLDKNLRLWSLDEPVRRFRTESEFLALVPEPGATGYLALRRDALLVLDEMGREGQAFSLGSTTAATAQSLQIARTADGLHAVVQGSDMLTLFRKRNSQWGHVSTAADLPGYLGVAYADASGVVAASLPVHVLDWAGQPTREPLAFPPVAAGPNNYALSVARSTNGAIAATIGTPDSARVRIAPAGVAPIRTLPYDPGGHTVMRFAGSTHLLVGSASRDLLWDITTGELVAEYASVRSGTPVFDFWQDDESGNPRPSALVLFGARDGVRVFDVWTGDTLAWMPVAEVRSARFTHDGQRVVTYTANGYVREWIVDQDELANVVQNQLWRDFTPDERLRYADLIGKKR